MEIELVNVSGAHCITSEVFAKGLGSQHKNVLELIDTHRQTLESRGRGLVAFETRPRLPGQHGGGDVRIAILNRRHTTALGMLTRNSPEAVEFKMALEERFHELEQLALRPAPVAPPPEPTKEQKMALIERQLAAYQAIGGIDARAAMTLRDELGRLNEPAYSAPQLPSGQPAPRLWQAAEMAAHLGYPTSNRGLMMALGKALATGYRQSTGQEPPRSYRLIDGAQREVMAYPESWFGEAAALIQGFMSQFTH